MTRLRPPISSRPKVLEAVSTYYNLDPFQKTRKREVAFARHVCFYFLWTFTDMGVEAIGKLFGMDHSTVCHGKKMVTDLCDSYPDIAIQVLEIKSKLE